MVDRLCSALLNSDRVCPQKIGQTRFPRRLRLGKVNPEGQGGEGAKEPKNPSLSPWIYLCLAQIRPHVMRTPPTLKALPQISASSRWRVRWM